MGLVRTPLQHQDREALSSLLWSACPNTCKKAEANCSGLGDLCTPEQNWRYHEQVFRCEHGFSRRVSFSCAEGVVAHAEIRMEGAVHIPSEIGRFQHLETLRITFPLDADGSLELPWQIGKLPLNTLELRGGSEHENDVFENCALPKQRPERIAFPIPSWIQSSPLDSLLLRCLVLSGQIPTELGRMAILRTLDLSDNLLSGQIPSQISRIGISNGIPNRYNTQNIIFSGNRLSGEVPTSFTACPLETLRISDNVLKGTIALYMQAFVSHGFYVGANLLEGTVPSEAGRLSKLYVLSIYGNRLEGTLPTELFTQKPNLIRLVLHMSFIGGTIPTEIGKLTFIRTMSLYKNRLDGEIPRELGKLSHLETLLMHENALSGLVPPIRIGYSKYGVTQGMFGLGFTLQRNRLSCTLPFELLNLNARDSEFFQAVPDPHVFVVTGNRFFLPMPSWLPKYEKDPYHFVEYTPWILFGAVCGGFVILIIAAGFFGCRNIFFMRDVLHMLTTGRCGESKGRGYQIVCATHLLAWRKFTVMAVVHAAAWVIYITGSTHYRCNGFLAIQSAANFSSIRIVEVSLCLIWVGHIILVAYYSCEFEFDEGKRKSLEKVTTCRGILTKLLFWVLWIVFASFASLPSIFYVSLELLPGDNTIKDYIKNRGLRMRVVRFLLSCAAASATVPLPILSRMYGHHCHISAIALLFVAIALSTWVFPAALVFVFHERCLGHWRSFWGVCSKNRSSLDMVIGQGWDRVVTLTGDQLCHAHLLQDIAGEGNCARSIIEMLAPFLSQKLFITAFIEPVGFLCLLKLLVLCKKTWYKSLFFFWPHVQGGSQWVAMGPI